MKFPPLGIFIIVLIMGGCMIPIWLNMPKGNSIAEVEQQAKFCSEFNRKLRSIAAETTQSDYLSDIERKPSK